MSGKLNSYMQDWIPVLHQTQKSTQNELKTSWMWDTTKKLLEEHIVGLDINLSNGFFSLTPKAQINKL